MPELVVSDEAVPSTSSNSLMNFKEKLFGRKHRRNSSDVEAGDKRPTSGSTSSSDANNGIEETLYTPSFEKRALIFGGSDIRKDSSLKHPKNHGIFASTDTISSSDKQCRICHSGAESRSNPLISPCRCNGTMKYVHTACLIKWLEISSEKFWPTSSCELCGFKFERHQFWRIHSLHWPSSTYQDRVLNFLFVFLLCLMFICASIASSYAQAAEKSRFRATRVVRIGNTYFSGDEITVVIAGVLFFMSFVLALCTQYRAGGTIFRLIVRFWTINRNWQIRDYNSAIDDNIIPRTNVEAALLP
jgi:E3 ubiquitin-protein ligase MARCH1/8